MKPAIILGTTWAWIFLAGTVVRADLVAWSYSWSPASPAIAADNPSQGKVTLSSEPPSAHAVGDSDIVASNLKVFSSADPNQPATFTHSGYSLTLTLTDTTTHQSGTLNFTGELNGTVSSGSSNLHNTFTGATSKSLTLQDTRFNVSMNSFVPPSPPGASNVGSIGVHVTVSQSRKVQSTPEPGSMILAGLGLALCALFCWWKRGAGCQAAWTGA